KEIQEAAYQFHHQVETKERIVVGVNAFVDKEVEKIPILHVDPKLERQQIVELERVRKERDTENVNRALAQLEEAAKGRSNLMPFICKAVEAYATVGEVSAAMRKSFGKFQPVPTL